MEKSPKFIKHLGWTISARWIHLVMGTRFLNALTYHLNKCSRLGWWILYCEYVNAFSSEVLVQYIVRCTSTHVAMCFFSLYFNLLCLSSILTQQNQFNEQKNIFLLQAAVVFLSFCGLRDCGIQISNEFWWKVESSILNLRKKNTNKEEKITTTKRKEWIEFTRSNIKTKI